MKPVVDSLPVLASNMLLDVGSIGLMFLVKKLFTSVFVALSSTQFTFLFSSKKKSYLYECQSLGTGLIHRVLGVNLGMHFCGVGLA